MESEKSSLLLHYQVYNSVLQYVEDNTVKVNNYVLIRLQKLVRQYNFADMKPGINVYTLLLYTYYNIKMDIRYSSDYLVKTGILGDKIKRWTKNYEILSKIRYFLPTLPSIIYIQYQNHLATYYQKIYNIY